MTWGHSARYALRRVLRNLPRNDRDEVLIPAFACIALVEPILAAGYKVRFFDNPSLKDTDLDLVGSHASERTRAMVVIHNFGYLQDTTRLAGFCRDRGILLIENFTHSIPIRDFIRDSRWLEHCDIALFGLKKFLPAPDGGFAIHRSDLGVASTELARPPRSEVLRDLYRAAERSLGTRRWRPAGTGSAPPNPLLQRHSEAMEVENATVKHGLDAARNDWDVSTTSKRLWESCDLDGIANARRRNFVGIQDALSDVPMIELPFRESPETFCLWGVPFLAPEIPEVDYKLRSLGLPVFTFALPLHPALGNSEFPIARSWATQIKLLPVHQDLTADDVNQIRPAFEAVVSQHRSGPRDRHAA